MAAVDVKENELVKDIVIAAVDKLKNELKNANDKDFAKTIIEYLIGRVKEDENLASDVMQRHKAWKKCVNYLFEQARKQAGNSRSAAVRDDVVYEWAEDYYRKDDKAEEERKAKEAAARKQREKEASKEKSKAKPAEDKPKKSPKEMDGQMNLFSMMGEA